jgi:hypothetical protein
MTKEQRETYIKSGGNHCPMCESADITGGYVTTESLEAWQSVWCNECGAEWLDVFKFSHVQMEEKEIEPIDREIENEGEQS